MHFQMFIGNFYSQFHKSAKKNNRKARKGWFFQFLVTFQDVVSKIAAFVKVIPSFFGIRKLLSNLNWIIQGHILWNSLYLQAFKYDTGHSQISLSYKIHCFQHILDWIDIDSVLKPLLHISYFHFHISGQIFANMSNWG